MRDIFLVGLAVVVCAVCAPSRGDILPPAAVDTTTQGNWVGVYGSDGYVLFSYDGSGTTATDRVSLPAYVSGISDSYAGRWVYNADADSDVRAVQDPLDTTQRVAAVIYSWGGDPSVTIDCSQTGKFRLALYMLDWDSAGREQSVGFVGGGLSGTDTVSDFAGGKWYVYDVDPSAGASVTVTLYTDTGPNAVLSALAFDPIPEPATLALLALPAAALIRRRRHL